MGNVRIRHLLSNGSARRDNLDASRFFLRNTGGFLSLSPHRSSRYDGWFIEDTSSTPSHFTKLLESLTYVKDADASFEPTSITITDQAAFWEYGDGAKFGFQLTPEQNGLLVRASRLSTLRLVLDMRDMYQVPEFGREYQVTRVAGGIVVRYTDSYVTEPIYLHLSCQEVVTLQNTWEKADYPWDAARHSSPNSLYTFCLGEVTTSEIALGAGRTPEAAQMAAHAARRLNLEVVGVGISYAEDDLQSEIAVAKTGAKRSLDWLRSDLGTYAGLPWFHQVWSRDELIAALGMHAEEQREIIQRVISYSLEHGELPTFQGSGTTCADGVGWLALLLREHGFIHLSEAGRKALAAFFETAYQGLTADRLDENGFINSGHNATWMDTIGREGHVLEIQCMFALLLETLALLSKDASYEEKRQSFLTNVRQHFFRDGYLYDRLDDPSKRPNVFLAYLLQPDLLQEEEWKSCFATVISTLSTPWGGFSSLDQQDPRYQAESTGEDNQSYHNGDSWFFINNLAAVALQRCDAHVYAQTINRLVKGSTEEILWKNMLGLAGEIASSESGTSWGCGIQAFSAGTYLFLLNELGN